MPPKIELPQSSKQEAALPRSQSSNCRAVDTVQSTDNIVFNTLLGSISILFWYFQHVRRLESTLSTSFHCIQPNYGMYVCVRVCVCVCVCVYTFEPGSTRSSAQAISVALL